MTKIYESPDGGKTVYVRKSGNSHRTLIKGSADLGRQQMWDQIHRVSQQDVALQQILEQAEIYYQMKNTDMP